MKTNNASLQSLLEARCSTSQPRIWYSYSGANNLAANAASMETDASAWSESAGTLTSDSTQAKYGAKCAKIAWAAQNDTLSTAVASPGSYSEATVTFSVRVLADDSGATDIQVGITETSDDSGTTMSSTAAASDTAWRVFQVTRTLSTNVSAISCLVKNLHGGAATFYVDGAKFETASAATQWSSRFFDVDDLKSDGVTINATEFSSLLVGRLEWGYRPDESAPAPLMSMVSELTFEIADNGSTLTNWSKQGTGVHLRIGCNTSEAYGDCTPAFHGVIWDWELVEGTQNRYRVTAYGLEKLWQEQRVGADAADGPRAWGVTVDTITTVANKWIYPVTGNNAYHLYKATYANQEVNQQNAVVCKWPFSTSTDTKYYLHAMFPIGSNTLVAEYFTGRSYSDVIDYFESLTGINGNMPATRTGHGGDTLTATLGPWATLDAGASAWRSLADAAGIKYHGYYYDEYGRIKLKSLAGTRSASGVTRSTATAGQVREVQRLDDVYRVNDPCVEFTKYGTDSATGSLFPVQTTTNLYQGVVVVPDGITDQVAVLNATPVPSVPKSHAGNWSNYSFDAEIVVDSPPTAITGTIWQAEEEASGAVTIGGDGKADLEAAANADAAYLESAAQMGAESGGSTNSWCFQCKIQLAVTNKTCFIGLKDGAGADQTWRVGVIFNASGKVGPIYWDASNNYYVWRSTTNGLTWGLANTAPVTAYAANTYYWVTIEKLGGNYIASVADEYGIPLAICNGATIATGSVRGSNEYGTIGDDETSSYTCDANIYDIRYWSPHSGDAATYTIDNRGVLFL